MNDKDIYRMSTANNLKSSILILGFLFAFIGLNIYLSKNHQYYNLTVFLYSILVFLPGLGPATFVHVEYLILNWKATLEVDKASKELQYRDEEKEIKAGFDDITKIIKHQVKNTALLYGFYEYYEIYLQSGDILVITNLMARDLSIPGIEIEIVDRYFPSVWWYNNVSSQ